MASFFFDTSAFVKRYQVEQGTDVVDSLFEEIDARFFIARLGLVETISALALRVRAGDLDHLEYSKVRKRVHSDIRTGKVLVVRMLVRHFVDAERLINTHGPVRRLRTLDALQLSIALDANSQGRIDRFVCADQSLCEVATLEGLLTLNPLTDSLSG
jgi:predicted nucleic acid-binding protein